MPVLESSYNRVPFYMFNGHWETVIPSMFFKVEGDIYTRERLELSDGDFLNIDWVKNGGSKKCIILTHGLEGDSGRYYVKRPAKFFSSLGWDIAAWNCRSCGGEMNRLPRFYHHGDTPDLEEVVDKVLSEGYEEVLLMGFSMGGSMVLKYLGEKVRDPRVIGGSAVSVPCNLRDSAVQLKRPENRFYEKRFVKKLVAKVKLKSTDHPDIVYTADLDTLEDFDIFHDRFTAPLHGFTSRDDFFNQATCDQYLHQIDRPVLILNAENDPMLGEKCYPYAQAEANDNISLEVSKRGGHCGFTLKRKGPSYIEHRTHQFLNEQFGY